MDTSLISYATLADIVVAATSVIAIILSIIALLKDSSKIQITVPKTLKYAKGHIGHIGDDGRFEKLFENTSDDGYYIISLRIINPKSYPIALFNISLADDHYRYIEYVKRLTFPEVYESKRLCFCAYDESIIGANLPLSNYQSVEAGSFSYIDLLIPVNQQCLKESQYITLVFRDSLPTLFTRTMLMPNSANIHHRVHKYCFNLSELQIEKL